MVTRHLPGCHGYVKEHVLNQWDIPQEEVCTFEIGYIHTGSVLICYHGSFLEFSQ